MPFRCPYCAQPDALEVSLSIQLPPDSRSDEIFLQVVACQRCGFQGLAVYEESRRGALEHESWDHTGYHVEPGRLAAIVQAIESCPAPNNPACACSTHRDLGWQDATGRWKGIDGLTMSDSFRMEISE
jgi:hypothetical protein